MSSEDIIWMISNKLYSDVSLFISVTYVKVLLHSFLYILKIFLGQRLDLLIVINYIGFF